MWGNQTRVQLVILKCETCNVHLCVDCFTIFHTIEEAKELRKEFLQVVKATPVDSVDKDSDEIVPL